MSEQELAKRSVVLDEEIVKPDSENINLKSADENDQSEEKKSFQIENQLQLLKVNGSVQNACLRYSLVDAALLFF